MIRTFLFLLCSGFVSLYAQTSERLMLPSQASSYLRSVPFRHPAAMLFNSISALSCDTRGALIVADAGDNRIYKLLPNGEVRIVAGGKRGYADGKGANAEFLNISDISVNAEGEILVLDGQRVRKILANGMVTTLAGFPLRGSKDGKGTEARFNMPIALVAANDGRVFVADAGNQCLRLIETDGRVLTLPFCYAMPSALALDATGRLLVLDRIKNTIHRLIPLANTGVQGNQSTCMFDDSILVQFPQTSPILNASRMALTKQGDILILENNGSLVRKISANGLETTVWSGIEEDFSASDICMDRNDTIILANTRNGALYKLNSLKMTQLQSSQNMTQSQFSMTQSQLLMTASQRTQIK
jgi:hypothetical protein